MFTHPNFRTSRIAEIGSQLDEDLIVLDEIWLAEYERYNLDE
jgi:hypothetical protein